MLALNTRIAEIEAHFKLSCNKVQSGESLDMMFRVRASDTLQLDSFPVKFQQTRVKSSKHLEALQRDRPTLFKKFEMMKHEAENARNQAIKWVQSFNTSSENPLSSSGQVQVQKVRSNYSEQLVRFDDLQLKKR